ncbi:hypothetical protein SDC9_147776 [bioreactor metagenome]|uniref:Uncharacterized protein n=1 Tax=bioreactor metagenome TaxID=1076179 RepID=A0A645EGY1_9ZZZZ
MLIFTGKGMPDTDEHIHDFIFSRDNAVMDIHGLLILKSVQKGLSYTFLIGRINHFKQNIQTRLNRIDFIAQNMIKLSGPDNFLVLVVQLPVAHAGYMLDLYQFACLLFNVSLTFLKVLFISGHNAVIYLFAENKAMNFN